MTANSLIPPQGKKCLISEVSLAGGRIDTRVDHDTIKYFFKKELSQDLEYYGIEVIDNSVPAHDLTLALQFTAITEGSWFKRFFFYVLCLGLLNYLSHLLQKDWFAAGCGEAVVEVTGKVWAADQELAAAAVKLKRSGSYYLGPFAGSQRLLGLCLQQAAALLSSQINTSVIDHYGHAAGAALPATSETRGRGKKEIPETPEIIEAEVEAAALVKDMAPERQASGSDWKPLAAFAALIFLVALLGLCFCIVLTGTKKTSVATNKPKSTAAARKTPEDYDRLISKYTQKLEANPKEVAAYIRRGNAYYYKKDFDRALEDYNRALELSPKDANIYRNKGLVYYQLKDWGRALGEFNRALEIKPDFAPAHYSKAILLDKTGKPKEALEAYQSFLKYGPPRAKKYIQRARKRVAALEKQQGN
jgi:tetratricopeptide (TPR) repeat protein